MKYLRVAFISALCVVPVVATAQRGGAGEKRQPRLPGESASLLKLPTRSDFEDLSPSAFLRDKRKKLQLGDQDANALEAAEATAKERNKLVFAAYDSVRREMQRMADSPDLGDNANDSALRRMAFSNLLDKVREARAADRTEALGLIPADKKAQADDLLKDQDDVFDKKAVSGGGRGRRSGGE